MLISVPGGRFPRALLQPPRRASSSAGSSANAIPAGVAAFHYNQKKMSFINSLTIYWYGATVNTFNSLNKKEHMHIAFAPFLRSSRYEFTSFAPFHIDTHSYNFLLGQEVSPTVKDFGSSQNHY